MAFLEGLTQWAMGLAGIFGVLILLLLLGACIFYLGIFMVLIPGALIEAFTHDRNFKLVPWRVALVIGGVVGLFLIRRRCRSHCHGHRADRRRLVALVVTGWNRSRKESL